MLIDKGIVFGSKVKFDHTKNDTPTLRLSIESGGDFCLYIASRSGEVSIASLVIYDTEVMRKMANALLKIAEASEALQ